MILTNDSAGILHSLVSAYASCRTFRCLATLRRRIATDSVTESLFRMRLAYAKPQQVFLEWWLDAPKSQKCHTLIATDDAIVRCYWGTPEWQREASIEDAIASYAAISSGLTLHLPSLLLGCENYRLFEKVEKQARQLQGLYHVAGTALGDIERSVIVRPSDGMIVQMLERYSIPGGIVECQSEYSDIEIERPKGRSVNRTAGRPS